MEQPKHTFAAKSSTFCWRLERILACSESFVSSSETSGLQINFDSMITGENIESRERDIINNC